ncbi:aminotransferase class I/II-fold pyridoxal phosphate-dependent enzyme [Cohnella silvisoli]|uniref:Aminotransferase class I/II-fold pyridoxal phosphate-dependent enzyme n=1 Tax=Cohnella silvisoli TaxID=2873699 RepID=A0ABV1L3Q2_9BACL|nr:aminotransferase class I/II-fold pyridoxal phosphate-dependent enzyme [Cohnella silvisoli]
MTNTALDKYRAPLYEALDAHARLEARAFHVPGHKQHAAWEDELAASYYGSVLALDLTELSDTDDLHHPEGPLADAQRLAADCWGADETRFLVGGSTAGNLAMIIGICDPGDLIILQRNVHKSVIHGLMMAGARAVMLPPDIDPVSGLATAPRDQLLKAALEQYPEAKAVILSAPNYYGMSPDLNSLIQLAHEYGIPVLVDEAHGPHFGFHPAFPTSALHAGADIVVQSTHKMLSAMTMGAMLHMQGNRIPRESVRQALTMVQSSSPSFPIMASLDLARRQLHTLGANAFHSALEAVELVTAQLDSTPFRALGYGEYANNEITYDPLKLVLFDKSGKQNGFELRDALLKRKCVAEMADSRCVVMAFGTGSTLSDGESLMAALKDIANHTYTGIIPSITRENNPALQSNNEIHIPEPIVFTRHIFPVQTVPLDHSVGLTAAEWVIPYPPGIPVLYPGETITSDIVKQLQHWKHEGAQIQGAQDPELQFIQVQSKT